MSTDKKTIRKQFRDGTFARDGYRCVLCGFQSFPARAETDLDAHHVTDRSLMPGGGYVKSNGVTLCKVRQEPTTPSCHERAEAGTPGASELYDLIGSSWEEAVQASLQLPEAGGFYKYPKTMHVPWSPGTQSDDRILTSVSQFVGKEVVVSEKCDGENTSMYRDHYHARSIDSLNHPSRNFVKQLWGNIRHDIPDGFRLCGENVYAKHSIHYRALTSYFYLFALYDQDNICMSWDDTVEWAALLGLETVPVLYRGVWDEDAVKACWTGRSVLSGEEDDPQEGYVVRVTDAFPWEDHGDNFAKYVRKDHVQTSSHWLNQPVVPNKLRSL